MEVKETKMRKFMVNMSSEDEADISEDSLDIPNIRLGKRDNPAPIPTPDVNQPLELKMG
jgi:hypothetical protein